MTEPLRLAITSSTGLVGVAIGRGDVVLAHRHAATDRRHAEELTPMLAAVLADAAVRVDDLDGIVVDVGPGRFTGLRVGVAAARTLALVGDLPVVPVTSLESLATDGAATAGAGAGGCVAVVDARRAEVFVQRFVDGAPVAAAVSLSPEAAAALVVEGDVVCGDGADRYPEAFAGATVVPGLEPSAATMLALAADRPGRPGPEVEPAYLRDPDVQINIKTRHTPPKPRRRRRSGT